MTTASKIEDYRKKQKFIEQKIQCYTDSTWWDSMIFEDDWTRIRSYDNDD
ncbi:MAG: hypothetical protein BWY21_02200 [Parcubacteria group bacterium ADurb.Bin216]|nr:MAG: hypothetical protein BWY21_02200 [Parcubacteria group bacterium ADurb.Bin216]